MSTSSRKLTKGQLPASEAVNNPDSNQKDLNVTAVERKRSFEGKHKNIERVPPLIIPGYVIYG